MATDPTANTESPKLAIGSARIGWEMRKKRIAQNEQRRMLVIDAAKDGPWTRKHARVVLTELQAKALREWLEKNP